MGTKIVERITTNSLGLKSVDRSGFIRFDVNGKRKSSKVTLTDYGQEVEEEEEVVVIRSMDRFLEKQNAESIRHTMQAQEDIFKQQVRELHRVYNIQKMMMDQLKHRSQYWSINNKDQTTSSRERTGSCSGIQLENVVRDAKTTTNDHIDESELELTLSIGMSSSSTNKDMDYSSTTSFRSSSDNCNNKSNNNSNNNQENSGSNTPMSSSSTTSLDKEKKRPHWLFQGLSINRTS